VRALQAPCPASPAGRAPGETAEGPERRELSVGALTYTESRQLALALLGRDDRLGAAQAHVVARESQGIPYFVDELVKYIQACKTEARQALRAGGLALGEVLRGRVERLPESARRLLEVVAVAGRPVSLLDACEAADLGHDGRAAAATLRAERLVRGTGHSHRDEVEPYHDWVRETVVGQLPASRAEHHHLRLAEVLEASGHADVERLAVHYQGAGRLDRAAVYYSQAAERAAKALAFTHAARLYRLTLDLRGKRAEWDEEAVRLRSRLGDVLAGAGRGSEAAAEYLAAAGSAAATAAEAVELRRRAAMHLMFSGHLDEGSALLRTVLAARGVPPPGEAAVLVRLALRRCRLRLRGLEFTPRDASQVSAERLSVIDLCWSAGAALSHIDPIRGADVQTRGLALALSAGEPYRVARAFALEAATLAVSGCRDEARLDDLIGRTERLARSLGHPHLEGLAELARAIAAVAAGRWGEVRARLAAAEPVFRDRCAGAVWELDTVHHLSAWTLTLLGDVAELRKSLASLVREARDRGDLYAETNLGTFPMTFLRLADDDPSLAASELDRVMARWSHRGYHVQHAAAVRAWVWTLLYRGEVGLAWERLENDWPLYRCSLLHRVPMLRSQMTELRARAALAASDVSDDRDRLLREAERGASALDREGLSWAGAHAMALRAGLAVRQGRHGEAAGLFRTAAARYAAASLSLHAAASLRRAGQLMGGEPGKTLVEQADAALAAATVRAPARFAAVLAPLAQVLVPRGFGDNARDGNPGMLTEF
jgi:hypothetical protein